MSHSAGVRSSVRAKARGGILLTSTISAHYKQEKIYLSDLVDHFLIFVVIRHSVLSTVICSTAKLTI